jgi:acylphosphatase
MDKIRVRLIVKGRVQGVWFRDSTRQKANELGVYGWVKNRLDGNVEVVAEGDEQDVFTLTAWCHEGPPNAMVTGVDQKQDEYLGEFDSFDIVF